MMEPSWREFLPDLTEAPRGRGRGGGGRPCNAGRVGRCREDRAQPTPQRMAGHAIAEPAQRSSSAVVGAGSVGRIEDEEALSPAPLVASAAPRWREFLPD